MAASDKSPHLVLPPVCSGCTGNCLRMQITPTAGQRQRGWGGNWRIDEWQASRLAALRHLQPSPPPARRGLFQQPLLLFPDYLTSTCVLSDIHQWPQLALDHGCLLSFLCTHPRCPSEGSKKEGNTLESDQYRCSKLLEPGWFSAALLALQVAVLDGLLLGRVCDVTSRFVK